MAYDKRVYVDFNDGVGFVDISSYVQYDTLSVTNIAFNNAYKTAQSSCSFSVIFSTTLYNNLTTFVGDLPVKVTQIIDSIETPLFYGHIPYDRSWTYDGIIANTIIKLTAVDNIDYLSVPVGDVSFTGYSISDP